MDPEQRSKTEGKKQTSAANRRPLQGDQVAARSPESVSMNGLTSDGEHSPSPNPTSPSAAQSSVTLVNNVHHHHKSKQDSCTESSMSSAAAASRNGHTPAVPDTTTLQPEHSTLSSSQTQISKMKPVAGLSSSLPFSTSRALSMTAGVNGTTPTVAPPMTSMLSPFMADYKGGTENLSLSGYIELMTLQQGGVGNGTSGPTFSLLANSQSPTSSSSLQQHPISGGPHIGGTGGMHSLPSLHPPLYNSQSTASTADTARMITTSNYLPHVTNSMFPLPSTPASLLGGKIQPGSRPGLGLNHTSAFHQPTTAGLLALDPRTTSSAPQYPTSSSAGAKLGLLPSGEFSGGQLGLSLPPPPPPLSLSQQLPGGAEGVGGSGSGGGQGGSGTSRKRTHEESLQQERSGEDQDISGYGMSKVNMFPVDGGCGSIAGGDSRRGSTSDSLSSQPLQQLKWQAHAISEWHSLCDGALQDIPKIGFQVETDKGFNFSLVDDSFVCQKKNHFQVTVTVSFHRPPKFLKLKDGSIQPIERFVLDLHGVRFEQVNSCITLEQSKADRTKTKFEPETIEVPSKPDEQTKKTICRLHFSETTQNNMRKRGKPNPDQKHFSLVVSLSAETKEGSYLVVAHVSERIIVRASNPGNFDNDCDYAWLKGTNPEIVYHHGRVGINMDKPEEALSVHGNLHLTGQILQVSDYRVKKDIKQLDSQGQHLETLSQLHLYEYQLDKNLCAPSSPYPSTLLGCRDDKQYSTFEDHNTANRDENSELRGEFVTSVAKGSAGRGDLKAGSCHVITRGEGRREPVREARRQVGLLAQEVERILPHAVRVTDSTVRLSDGTSVSNILVVDKDQILMETIGAVQELKHIASALEQRMTELECAHENTNRQTYSVTVFQLETGQ